jgi:DNA-binding Lrp family transcriptional regulator
VSTNARTGNALRRTTAASPYNEDRFTFRDFLHTAKSGQCGAERAGKGSPGISARQPLARSSSHQPAGPRIFGHSVLCGLPVKVPGTSSFFKFLPTPDAVQECHHLTGNDAFLLKVILSSMDELESLIEKLLPYGSPTTSMVLSTPLERKQPTVFIDGR